MFNAVFKAVSNISQQSQARATPPQVLAPMQVAMGVFPQYCVPQQTTLVLREKVFSLSGDTFSIQDINGNTVMNCQGNMLSISGRKNFTAVDGKPLFDLRTKLLAIHKTFTGEAPDGTLLFTVQGKFQFGGSKMIATFTNVSNGQPIELIVKGDWFDRRATITWNDQVVAQIGRSFFNVGEIFANQQTYMVSIAPGVDLALLAAICVCLDERENEKKR